MDDIREYELVEAEYHRVYEIYQAASDEMLALAADPEAHACEFKWVADRVSRLATQLVALRTTLALLYPKHMTVVEEPLREGMQWLPNLLQ